MKHAPPPEVARAFEKALTGPRKPRIALMGEFCAGKSTLANLMIGCDPLPVQVIATQLPPIWISHGNAAPRVVGLGGDQSACDVTRLHEISPEDTAFVQLEYTDNILTLCDIIDMPGISDPNMSPDVWERILPLADAVIWCSPATQAWRQSEAAVWDTVPDRIQRRSFLLLTRGDMLVTQTDRAKVLRRVQSMTDGMFHQAMMVSLTQARDAGDDAQMWEASGVDPFVDAFMHILKVLSAEISGQPLPVVNAPPKDETVDQVTPRRPTAQSKTCRPDPVFPHVRGTATP
ncbi:dynamin family protein [Roseobacter sp.]|uniref:dynamin family protein n=1 Tax=Roseobacter sp. TaxID=1907202 RepID=UPI003298E9CB